VVGADGTDGMGGLVGPGGGRRDDVGAWDEEEMKRAKMVDGVWVKIEDDEDDHFSRSIDMYRGERTFIGVHKAR
jgi:DEAD/DEAH box helicase domain-containing protein